MIEKAFYICIIYQQKLPSMDALTQFMGRSLGAFATMIFVATGRKILFKYCQQNLSYTMLNQFVTNFRLSKMSLFASWFWNISTVNKLGLIVFLFEGCHYIFDIALKITHPKVNTAKS